MFVIVVFIYRVVPDWLSGGGQRPGLLWHHFAPYLIASGLLLPIVAHSAIRFSNRFAGPMVRIRRSLKQLAEGEIPHVVFRENDFWTDVADDINKLAARQARRWTVEMRQVEDAMRPPG
jgi:hypothetical protein